MTKYINKLENKDWRHNMTNYRFNLKALFLSLMVGIIIAGLTACTKTATYPVYAEGNDMAVIASQTGPVDPNGDLITDVVYVTNVIQVTNEIKYYVTNEIYHPGKEIYKTNYVTNVVQGKDIIYTNYVYEDRTIYVTKHVTNVVPDTNSYVSRQHKSFLYRVYAPFAGIGPEGEYKYTTVSYVDIPALSELWKRMINRKSFSGERFIIRNRTSGRYFYFDDNMDLRNSMNPNIILKRFVQGIIIQYKCGNDTKGAYAIAGLYKVEHDTKTISGLWDDGINIMQGYLFSQDRIPGEYDILVLNPGHVVNGSEYGFEMYNSVYNYAYGTNPYYEQRPEYYMSKITHVTEAWKNYRPHELYDLAFKVLKGNSLPNLWQ